MSSVVRMGLKPKSHPVSVLTVEDSAELTITFDLSTAVKVPSHLYRWLLGEQEKMNEYTFTRKTPEEIQFDIRFIHSGMPANNFRQLTLFMCINPLYTFGVVHDKTTPVLSLNNSAWFRTV